MVFSNFVFFYSSLHCVIMFHYGNADVISPKPNDPEYKDIGTLPLANMTKFRAKVVADFMKQLNKTGRYTVGPLTTPNIDLIKEFFSDDVTTITKPNSSSVSLFESILKSSVFVDHTMMMKDLIDKVITDCKIQLIHAPHGFGKSTNLDMMKRFFQVIVDKTDGKKARNKEDSESYRMFTDAKFNLKIAQEKEFIQQHLGEYPVIHLDLYKMDENPAVGLTRRVREVYDEYNRLCGGKLQKLQLPSAEKPLGLMTYAVYTLRDLARILSEYFNHKIMVFIDNYDYAALKLIPQKMIINRIYNVVGVMLFTMMKEMPQYTDYIIITGMTSLGKSYLLARDGLNINTHTFLEDHFATNYYGFTESEAMALFDQHNLTSDQKNLIKENCNGYITKNNQTTFYHPTPVRKYLLKKDPSELMNYWPKTGVFTPELYKFIRMHEVREKLMRFLWMRRDHVVTNVADMWIADLTRIIWLFEGKLCVDQGVKTFFSYLLDHGYLAHGGELDHFIIPNHEILRELNQLLLRFYTTDLEMKVEQFEATADAFSPLLTNINVTEEMISSLKNALNEFFQPFYRNRLITDGRLNPFPVMEFQTLISSAATLKFKYVSGKARIKPLGKPYVGRRTFGIVSNDNKIMLLMEIKYRESVESALDRIQHYAPVDFEPQVVRYLGINIGGDFKVEIGTCSDYIVF